MPKKMRFYLFHALAAASCAGCSRAPNVVVLGAFFPGWMVCALLGIALTLVIRMAIAIARPGHGQETAPLLYPLLALLCSALSWIIIFRGGA
jgi:hypothetical protein